MAMAAALLLEARRAAVVVAPEQFDKLADERAEGEVE
jgi:hypothetical protein